MFNWWNSKIQKMNVWDIQGIKIGSLAFTLVILNLWDAAREWVGNVSVWWFVALLVLAMIKPCSSLFKK